jgi:prepilin-type processing-associated H-X9-DG protein
MSAKRLMISATLVLTAATVTSGSAVRSTRGQGAAGQAQQAEPQKQDPAQKKAAAAKKAEEVRDARAKSENKLKQIALAMHNIASLSEPVRFPGAAIRDKNGKPLLSWRVAVLPYLEQNELYKKFHLDEPWDSLHNKALLKEIPEVYVPVIRTDEPKISTYYQVFTGPGALFENKEGAAFQEITDGTSVTLLVVEAGSPVPWTKPEDITYDKDKPLPKLGRMFRGGFNVAFADGSVRFLSAAIPEQVLRAVITRNGNDIVDRGELDVDEKPGEEGAIK